MCLASLLFHHRWIAVELNINHVVRVASHVFRDATVLEKINNDNIIIKVTYPWNDNNHVFTGVPPHVSLLQELCSIKEDQLTLIGSFVDRVKEALTDFGVNADRLSEQRLRTVLDEFQTTIFNQLNNINRLEGANNNNDEERVETGTGYRVHTYGGTFHRVPVDWRFPRVGLQDLWRQWWIGDTVRQVPPLRFVTTRDVVHLDSIPIEQEERHGRTGEYKEQRRPARKVMSEMKFVMQYVTDLVQ